MFYNTNAYPRPIKNRAGAQESPSMLSYIFRKSPVKEAADAIYAEIVAQARQEPFYAGMKVPDSVEGRFDVIVVHMALVLGRLRSEGGEAAALSQKLFDAMFKNMDENLRELGVGDLSVGKKIRKMAEAFYGRVKSYADALETEDDDAPLREALNRNVFGGDGEGDAAAMSSYMQAQQAFLARQPLSRLLNGIVRFSPPAEA